MRVVIGEARPRPAMSAVTAAASSSSAKAISVEEALGRPRGEMRGEGREAQAAWYSRATAAHERRRKSRIRALALAGAPADEGARH